MLSRLGLSRAWYLIAALATLMAGLVSRSLGLDKSHFIVMYVGDVLWAGLIYFRVPPATSVIGAGENFKRGKA